MYLSAIIHDYGHKGVNNDFLVKMQDDLALRYNDRSPMENHHVSATWILLKKEQFNFMRKMPQKVGDTGGTASWEKGAAQIHVQDIAEIRCWGGSPGNGFLPLIVFQPALQAVDVLRKQVIDMVLATDMKQV